MEDYTIINAYHNYKTKKQEKNEIEKEIFKTITIEENNIKNFNLLIIKSNIKKDYLDNFINLLSEYNFFGVIKSELIDLINQIKEFDYKQTIESYYVNKYNNTDDVKHNKNFINSIEHFFVNYPYDRTSSLIMHNEDYDNNCSVHCDLKGLVQYFLKQNKNKFKNYSLKKADLTYDKYCNHNYNIIDNNKNDKYDKILLLLKKYYNNDNIMNFEIKIKSHENIDKFCDDKLYILFDIAENKLYYNFYNYIIYDLKKEYNICNKENILRKYQINVREKICNKEADMMNIYNGIIDEKIKNEYFYDINEKNKFKIIDLVLNSPKELYYYIEITPFYKQDINFFDCSLANKYISELEKRISILENTKYITDNKPEEIIQDDNIMDNFDVITNTSISTISTIPTNHKKITYSKLAPIMKQNKNIFLKLLEKNLVFCFDELDDILKFDLEIIKICINKKMICDYKNLPLEMQSNKEVAIICIENDILFDYDDLADNLKTDEELILKLLEK
jgi:hypothetical protein